MKKKKFYILVILFLGVNISLLSLLLHLEASNPKALIKDVGDVFWYFIVTTASVGYGDTYPITHNGKIVSAFFIIQSMAILTIAIGQVSSYISNQIKRKKMGFNGTTFENHIVIIGWDHFSALITRSLIDAKKKVAIITDIKEHVDLIYNEFTQKDVFVFFANYHHIPSFCKVNISKSSVVFVNFKSDTEKLVAILNLKSEYGNLNFLVALEESNLKKTFQEAGVTYILSKNEIASKLTASFIFEPDVAEFMTDLLDTAKGEDDCDVQEFLVTYDSGFHNMRFIDVFNTLKKQNNVILIGICKIENGQRKLHKIPKDELIINNGDYLILIVNGDSAYEIGKKLKINQGINS